MATTTFSNGVTLTDADWFNDLDRLHYDILNDPADLAALVATLGATNWTITGNLAVNGNTAIGNAAGDSFTIHPSAWTLSNAVTITGTWTNLGTVTTVDINGGTIDNAAIGGATPAAGAFTTLTVTGDLINLAAQGGNAPYIQHTSNVVDIRAGTSGFRVLNNAATIGTFSVSDAGVATVYSNLTVSGGTITTGSTTALSLATSGGTQAQITNTASANRYITLTGSNGGNPTIGTSAGSVGISTNLDVTGFIEGAEQTAPSAPNPNGYRIFAQDNGAGKTQLMVIFGSGAAQQIAIEP